MTTQTSNSAMVKKMVSVIFFLVLFYVLPLLGKPVLLFNWQVIFLAVICSILFTTQPRLSISESKKKKGTDRNTIWLIIIVSGIGQIASLIEWAYLSASPIKTELSSGTEISGSPLQFDFEIFDFNVSTQSILSFLIITGALLLIAGTVFRLYAIRILGKYFTATVQIKDEHRIIKTGPYKLLRHPSYTGAYISMVGTALFLHSISGILIFGIGMLFIYHLRIKTEENTLMQNFGVEYLVYKKSTWKMFPYLW